MTEKLEIPERLRKAYSHYSDPMGPQCDNLTVCSFIQEIARLEQDLSAAKAENDRLREWLGDLYDRWENGTPCWEDLESSAGFVGNAFTLSADEEDALLKMLPPVAPSVALRATVARLTAQVDALKAQVSRNALYSLPIGGSEGRA